MAEQDFDLVVIGGGPGGYVAAIRAAQLGMRTAVVEREHLGGICLNWGCIPTKALLRSAEINHLLAHLDAYGFSRRTISAIDLDKVVARSRGNCQTTGLRRRSSAEEEQGRGVRRYRQPGRPPHAHVVASKAGAVTATLTAPHIILATGARARQLPGLDSDGTSDLVLQGRHGAGKSIPKRLLVIGSGAIGIEFASFFAQYGRRRSPSSKCIDRILPDRGCRNQCRCAQKAFEKQGMTFLLGARVVSAVKAADEITITIESAAGTQAITVDRVISAAGIVGNTEDLGLETTQAKIERTHVLIDEYCRTGEPGLYAIGDLAGAPWLAHKASHEGVVCVEKIAGLDVHPIDWTNIPGCTYCRPQIASVGLTEARAKAAGHELRVGRFPFIGNGKAIAMGEPEGMVKVVFDAKNGALLGAHMIGAEVTEMIQGYAIARTLETTESELMHTVFPHPTVSETMHEAVLDAYGRAVHF